MTRVTVGTHYHAHISPQGQETHTFTQTNRGVNSRTQWVLTYHPGTEDWVMTHINTTPSATESRCTAVMDRERAEAIIESMQRLADHTRRTK